MTKSEYLRTANEWEIVDEPIEQMKRVYPGRIPTILRRIISHSDAPCFFDDGSHVLSLAEMISVEDTLGFSFSDKHLIPVIDCCDGDYIVYDYEDGIWAIYNIIDGIAFEHASSLNELL